VQKIAVVISDKLKSIGQINAQSYSGFHSVAEMFNRLDVSSSKAILAEIESRDPKVFEAIRGLMFVFEDLMSIDQAGIKEITSRVDRKILTVALKGTSEQLRNHIFSTMSQRGAEMLKEDIEVLGPVKIREVESAQHQIIATVRQLEEEGVLSLSGGDGEYVV
jgi:flagellar motor switch protein FliG